MRITEVGKRGVLFYNDRDEVNYLIKGDHCLLLCDTSSKGFGQMKEIEEYVHNNQVGNKEWIIFNSHADYDHIWGNGYFKEATIISSHACSQNMKEKATFEAHIHKNLMDEPVEIVYPSVTFESQLDWVDEGIEFYYTPGHTVGDAICFDRREGILLVGDLVEAPIPYLGWQQLDVYIKTLHFLKTFDAVLVNGHNGIIDKAIIDDNIKYVTDVMNRVDITYLSGDAVYIHKHNLKFQLILEHDALIKELDIKEDYFSHKMAFWDKVKKTLNLNDAREYDLSNISFSDLKLLVDADYQEKLGNIKQ